MSVCSVCNKKAHITCGHGCDTVYCGESCAKSVYEIHQKLECYGLIGLQDTQTIIRQISGGSQTTVYQSLYRQFQFLQQELTQHLHLNWVQKKFNRSAIERSIQTFLDVAHYLIANRPDFDGPTRTAIQNLWNWVKGQSPMYLNSKIESPFDTTLPLGIRLTTPRDSCLSCGATGELVQCGALCGQARYCNQDCADNHWEEHKKDCDK